MFLEVRMQGFVLRRGFDAPWLPCVEGSGFTRKIQAPPVPRPWKERVTLPLDRLIICAIFARHRLMKAAGACSFLVAREREGEVGTETQRVSFSRTDVGCTPSSSKMGFACMCTLFQRGVAFPLLSEYGT